jgi:hypothetical protein
MITCPLTNDNGPRRVHTWAVGSRRLSRRMTTDAHRNPSSRPPACATRRQVASDPQRGVRLSRCRLHPAGVDAGGDACGRAGVRPGGPRRGRDEGGCAVSVDRAPPGGSSPRASASTRRCSSRNPATTRNALSASVPVVLSGFSAWTGSSPTSAPTPRFTCMACSAARAAGNARTSSRPSAGKRGQRHDHNGRPR